ncbi:hypothetical protein TrCOL_g3411 [Triparma columacea]|uniref:Uncharacterized protein n=1 Tax=Triparma columacea TaxID=722753 RepID=A0A9W7G831_9STRA|nr:hypothetical protein TrCOL_g3411 [Triparma columacea]
MDPGIHKVCVDCAETLPRNAFPKKSFATPTPQCTACRKIANAARMKQRPPAPQRHDSNKNGAGVSRSPNNHGFCTYLDRLFSMACFPTVASLGIFTTAKDVSEAFSAINAARKTISPSKSRFGKMEGNTLCLCIGDGCTPRSAALACFVEGWKCISIDPEMQDKWVEGGAAAGSVKGLTCFKALLSQFMDTPSPDEPPPDSLILLLIHSHARLIGNASIDKIRERYGSPPTCLISIPCCASFGTERDVGRPDDTFDDDCIFSAKRTVMCWKFD